MRNLREQQGALVPVEDRGVEENDYLIADVHVKVDGNVVAHQHDAQLVARPGRIGRVPGRRPAAAAGRRSRPARRASIRVKAADDHPSEQIRGKEVEIEVALKDVKRLELAEVTPAFLEELGFENEQELRDALREQMQEKIDYDVRQAMREQVNRYLLDNVHIQLPEKLSDKQTDRVVGRRAIDLMQRGVSRGGRSRRTSSGCAAAAKDEAARELKLFFILQKVAEEQDVDVTEGELNGRIAMLAAQRGQRPEKLKQQMTKDGSWPTCTSRCASRRRSTGSWPRPGGRGRAEAGGAGPGEQPAAAGGGPSAEARGPARRAAAEGGQGCAQVIPSRT